MKTLSIILLLGLISCAGVKEGNRFSTDFNTYQRTYKEGFLNHPRSPLNETEVDSLDFYPPDISWKIECSCAKADGAEPFDMPTYSGVTRRYILFAIAECRRGHQKFSLSLFQNIHPPINPLYKNQLFLPFKDETNGDSTYGGGRYMNLVVSDIKNDKIIIDFNRSYNPWCAYSDGYNCPIPPKNNHLAFEVNAGEKLYKGSYKQAGKK